MIYALYGFLLGLLIPYTARRFAKFMPATFAYALYRIVKPNKSPLKKKQKQKELKKYYFWRSVMCGLITAALEYTFVWRFGTQYAGWSMMFVVILLLLAEVDYRMYLLPDILTVPLILFGFAFAVSSGLWCDAVGSAAGALVGYFIPVIASLFLVWKHADAFGGGDVKFLAGVGAWLGHERVLYVIVAATVIFAIYALIKKKRTGAFGPAISVAALGVALLS